MLIQTWALIIAAYRELNAKKLFWITMGINLLLVVVFAALGISAKGVTFLHWTLPSDFMNTSNVSPEMFYRLYFVEVFKKFWLTWAATILALVSTAGMVPDLIRGGTIETMLSKPISRTRLFLTKYTSGLLFVVLQVAVFSFGSLLVIGIRGDAWDFRILLAIPIIAVFFSYLFSICAVFGMITKSTITALLLTFLVWAAVFATNAADTILVQQRESVAVQIEDLQQSEANYTLLRDRSAEQVQTNGPDTALGKRYATAAIEQQANLSETQAKLITQQASLKTWTKWTSRLNYARTILPKTGETTGLLNRYLMSREEVTRLMTQGSGVNSDADDDIPSFADPRATERAEEARRDRSVLWIVGTSLLFEGVMLLIATGLFVRRDF
ncbi:MAG: ABC-type transport system involved in multi-copper enzyme maturation permease subunit [Phycisphaerales bacterium]|jgi:ABC-type transport system involved in multi-copper enzyme maturation permease subunit